MALAYKFFGFVSSGSVYVQRPARKNSVAPPRALFPAELRDAAPPA